MDEDWKFFASLAAMTVIGYVIDPGVGLAMGTVSAIIIAICSLA